MGPHEVKESSYCCQHEVTQITQLAADEHFLQINPSIADLSAWFKGKLQNHLDTWAWEQKFKNLWDTEKQRLKFYDIL